MRIALLESVTALFGRSRGRLKETLIPFRERTEARAAIVFIHGFSGDVSQTWGNFPQFLQTEARLESWDIFALGYASSLRVDVPRLWTADPSLSLLATSLRTALTVPPLDRYDSIALVAHSMGGLVAQRTVLERNVAARVGHLMLMGTPSGGLGKAFLGAVLKRQARDMFVWSRFIRTLRRDWNAQYENGYPFELCVAHGEQDEFVPASSSLSPFPTEFQRVVPGNHLGMVKPVRSSDRSVQLVVDTLCRTKYSETEIDSATLAVERRSFNKAVDLLWPRAAALDDAALVQLALALEGVGRQDDAIAVLVARYRGGVSSTDALGVLAGRLKRMWLAGRDERDFQMARALYENGLRLSDSSYQGALQPQKRVDPEQAMYHAINIAFLDVMHGPPAGSIPDSAREMAERAHGHARTARQTHWKFATEGDALVILDDLDSACRAYELARKSVGSPREVDSIYSQAIRLTAHIFGVRGLERIRRTFALPEQHELRA